MPSIIGILNCTPDSFSDGASDISHSDLLDRARKLCDEGADILDIGGDSTRPGSVCVGIEDEWARIAPVITEMPKHLPCSVDTHHPEIARRALEHGATYINDISGRFNEEMLSLIVKNGAHYIFMFNAHSESHAFDGGLLLAGAFSTITQWIATRTKQLTEFGIAAEKLIADPGMGAFISRDPVVSWEVINRFGELPAPGGGLLLGCSRKGFLAGPNEREVLERDERSCIAGAYATSLVPEATQTFLRVHNVALQRSILSRWSSMSPSERAL